MIGIMEVTDRTLFIYCRCLIHRQQRLKFQTSRGKYKWTSQTSQGEWENLGEGRPVKVLNPRPLSWYKKLKDDRGQDIAEYAVMLAVMLVLVIGLLHQIGIKSASVFSQIGSKLQ